MEYACGILSILYAVTTYKENGLAMYAAAHGPAFPGDGGGFYALMPLPASTHTLANIRLTGEFCVNFLPVRHFDALMRTVRQNGMEDDEFTEGRLHAGARPHCGCSGVLVESFHAGMQSRTHRSSFRFGTHDVGERAGTQRGIRAGSRTGRGQTIRSGGLCPQHQRAPEPAGASFDALRPWPSVEREYQ